MYIPENKGTEEPTYHFEYQEVDIANYGLKKRIGLTSQAMSNKDITYHAIRDFKSDQQTEKILQLLYIHET